MTEWLRKNFESAMQSLINSSHHSAPSSNRQNSRDNAGGQSSAQVQFLEWNSAKSKVLQQNHVQHSVQDAMEAMDLASGNQKEEQEPEEELCAICLEKPCTSGFFHADE